jgi:ring-1,2-phenylacetyl-CoA epoxidase subunit PaaC
MDDGTTAYESLADARGGEERWAFGTGFDDPLAGVDTTVPPSVDARSLALQCLALGDDALVMSQRLASWCSNAPELEDDVALANLALDLLGQARLLLSRAAQAHASVRPADAPAHLPDEDALAYFRAPRGFRNVRLAELDDGGDFARCIARLFVFATWRLAELTRLADAKAGSNDPVLAAIAVKGATELTYHREYAAGWLVRLGDGTEVSHERMQAALDWVWAYVDELFDGVESAGALRAEFDDVLRQACTAATLAPPRRRAVSNVRGRDGNHTEALSELLADFQGVARAHPTATW